MSDPVPTLYGPMNLPDWPEDLICRALLLCGEWAEAEAELVAPLLDPGETLWDVGAYLGTFALGLSRLVPPGRIVAIDASSALQKELRANLMRNAPCPVEVVHSGVAASEGWIAPAAGPEGKTNHGARAYEATDDRQSQEVVRCRRLSDLRGEYGDYDFLKLDIEGMEESALRGDLGFIRQRRPVIWAECNEDGQSLRSWSLLRQLGYLPVYLGFPAFRRQGQSGAAPIYPIAYEAGLLAAPEERMARLTGKVRGEEIICRPVATALDLRMALFDTPRWGREEWAGLGRPELLARLGRAIRGQRPGDFF